MGLLWLPVPRRLHPLGTRQHLFVPQRDRGAVTEPPSAAPGGFSLVMARGSGGTVHPRAGPPRVSCPHVGPSLSPGDQTQHHSATKTPTQIAPEAFRAAGKHPRQRACCPWVSVDLTKSPKILLIRRHPQNRGARFAPTSTLGSLGHPVCFWEEGHPPLPRLAPWGGRPGLRPWQRRGAARWGLSRFPGCVCLPAALRDALGTRWRVVRCFRS